MLLLLLLLLLLVSFSSFCHQMN